MAAAERAFPAMGVREIRAGLAAREFSAREIAELPPIPNRFPNAI